jgi:hypothetical protein
MFHHHNYKVVAYEKASFCQKAVYNANKTRQCSHKAHIRIAVEKCFLCDNHNLTDHINNIPFFGFSNTEIPTEYNSVIVNFISHSSSKTSNRGPPAV